jgi:hypothetical protein
MSDEEMNPEETAIRIATVVSMAMNVTAMLDDQAALSTIDPIDLRSMCLQFVDEMCWLASIVARGTTAGISWPADAQERIERLRSAASAWDAIGPPPPVVMDAARRCFGIIACHAPGHPDPPTVD